MVYLQISYDELKSRLSDLQERGVVLKNGVGMSLHELFDERKPLYEKYAEVTVNVDDLTITAAARKVASALKGSFLRRKSRRCGGEYAAWQIGKSAGPPRAFFARQVSTCVSA